MLVRQAAVECLNQVLHASLKADVLVHQLAEQCSERDHGLLHELVYGVLRRRYSLEADFSRFCNSKPDHISESALLLGTYQLRHMRVPTHAAVSETVAVLNRINPKAAGFVNAVLRRVAEHAAPAKLKPNQRAELPKWMYARWRDAFGTDVVQQFCEALRQPPALCLAVFSDRSEWMAQVQAMGIKAEVGYLSALAVLLPSGTDVTALPGFDEGVFTVMDQSAQAAVLALQPSEPCGLIVDLCAAPGGKTALLAHRFPQAQIIAVEFNARRMPRLRQNLARLRCSNIQLVQADAMLLPLADGCADAVFLDAPCSASGIFRRHPDAKFLHGMAEVQKLSKVQISMLTESLRVLKVGAPMVYAVCSIHPEENEQVVNELSDIISDIHAVNRDMQRIYPGLNQDGFFHACIEKSAMEGL